jgi:hypothetical protein
MSGKPATPPDPPPLPGQGRRAGCRSAELPLPRSRKAANDNISALVSTIAGLSDAAGDAGDEIVVTGHRIKNGVADIAKMAGLSKNGSPADQGTAEPRRSSPTRSSGDPVAFRSASTMPARRSAGPSGNIPARRSRAQRGKVRWRRVHLRRQGQARPAQRSAARSATSSARRSARPWESLGKLSEFAGPAGAVVGGIAGSLLGSASTVTKKGVANIAVDASGNLKVASITGNNSQFKTAAGSSADCAISTIQRIADQFGATVTGQARSRSASATASIVSTRPGRARRS